MEITKRINIAAAVLLLAGFYAAGLEAGNLHANTQKIIFEKESQTAEFSFTSHQDKPVEVVANIIIPAHEELEKGFLPISDAGWVVLENNRFSLKPEETAILKLHKNISANKEDAIRQSYQAMLWVHTTGGLVESGVKVKVLIK